VHQVPVTEQTGGVCVAVSHVHAFRRAVWR
jgi:hypothetical protein